MHFQMFNSHLEAQIGTNDFNGQLMRAMQREGYTRKPLETAAKKVKLTMADPRKDRVVKQILFRQDIELDEQHVQRQYLVRYGGHPEIMVGLIDLEDVIVDYPDLVRRFDQLMDEGENCFHQWQKSTKMMIS